MRILITGSSGQIGTNLALRLMQDGHSVFGVDKRVNTWTDSFRYVLQDLSSNYPPYEKGIGGVEYPPVDLVVHLAAHAKVHELVRLPHRAMENITMTYNVLEYCRLARLPIVFSSSREVYGDVHRFTTEETHADFAYTESTYSASKIAGEALIYSYARCYGLQYLVFRFSNVYGRFDNDLARMVRVIPLFIHKIARDGHTRLALLGLGADAYASHVVERTDDLLGPEKSESELEVIARRPHDDRERLAVERQL